MAELIDPAKSVSICFKLDIGTWCFKLDLFTERRSTVKRNFADMGLRTNKGAEALGDNGFGFAILEKTNSYTILANNKLDALASNCEVKPVPTERP